jgi:hypothetical protein
MARHRLPVLRHRDDLRIPDPCDERFEDMTPEGRGRRCAACDHVVHDMSAMTAREAARFLAARKGQRTCVHFELRPDGSVRYRDDGPRPAAPLLALALAACTPHGPPPALELEVVEVAAPALPSPTVVPEQPSQSLLPPDPPGLETAGILPCVPPSKPAPAKQPKQPRKPKSDLVIDGMYFE